LENAKVIGAPGITTQEAEACPLARPESQRRSAVVFRVARTLKLGYLLKGDDIQSRIIICAKRLNDKETKDKGF